MSLPELGTYIKSENYPNGAIVGYSTDADETIEMIDLTNGKIQNIKKDTFSFTKKDTPYEAAKAIVESPIFGYKEGNTTNGENKYFISDEGSVEKATPTLLDTGPLDTDLMRNKFFSRRNFGGWWGNKHISASFVKEGKVNEAGVNKIRQWNVQGGKTRRHKRKSRKSRKLRKSRK